MKVAFDQSDLHSTPEYECRMDCGCQVLVSRLETLDTITDVYNFTTSLDEIGGEPQPQMFEETNQNRLF